MLQILSTSIVHKAGLGVYYKILDSPSAWSVVCCQQWIISELRRYKSK